MTLSAVEEILADLPMAQIASQLGVDEATAESADRQAIPALLGGLRANSEDPAGAASLAGALGDHSADLLGRRCAIWTRWTPMTARRSSATSSVRTPTRWPRPSAATCGSQAGGLIQSAAADLGADRAGLSVQAAHGAAPRGGQDDPLGRAAQRVRQPGGTMLPIMLGGGDRRGAGRTRAVPAAPDPRPTPNQPGAEHRALDPRHAHRHLGRRQPLRRLRPNPAAPFPSKVDCPPFLSPRLRSNRHPPAR